MNIHEQGKMGGGSGNEGEVWNKKVKRGETAKDGEERKGGGGETDVRNRQGERWRKKQMEERECAACRALKVFSAVQNVFSSQKETCAVCAVKSVLST